MKTLNCCALLVLTIFTDYSGLTAAGPATPRIDLKIEKVVNHRGAIVTVSGFSATAVRVWQDSNSWGAFVWRVLRIRGAKVDAFYQNPDQFFTRNIPAFETIGGEVRLRATLDLNGGNWCWMGKCSTYYQRGIDSKTITFDPGDMIVVVYDVPSSDKAVERGVWYGVAATSMTIQ